MFKIETYSNLRHEVFNKEEPHGLTAASIAFGIFMGIVPIWGFQMVTAIALAVFFRLNKALVLISANISIPPMIPIIIYLSYQMGSMWVGEEAVPLTFAKTISMDTAHLNFMQYIYGSITLAILSGLLFGFATWLILSIYKKEKITIE